MGQLRYVPSRGVNVEFPDDWNDDQINSWVRKKSAETQDMVAAQQIANRSKDVAASLPEKERNSLGGQVMSALSTLNKMANPVSMFGAISGMMSNPDYKRRAEESIKLNEKSKREYLESQYGAENLGRDASGNVYVKNEAGKFRPLDPRGFDEGDIADMVGPAMEFGPGAIAGLMTGGVIAPAMSEMGGNALRQYASSQLPGDDAMTPQDRATSIGVAGVMGGAPGAIAKTSTMAYRKAKVMPHNLIAKHIQKASDSPHTKGSDILEEKTGIQFLPGARSGDEGLVATEQVLRQHFRSKDIMASHDIKNANQSKSNFVNLMRSIGSEKSPAQIGSKIKTMYDDALWNIVKARKADAGGEFEKFNYNYGHSRAFPPSNYIAKIDELIGRKQSAGGGINESLRKQLIKIRDDITDESGNPVGMTGYQFQNKLAEHGDAAFGRGQKPFFADLKKNEQLTLNRELYESMMQDLDDMIVRNENVPAVNMLKSAREKWRDYTQQLDDIRASSLGKIIKNDDITPESVTEAVKKSSDGDARYIASWLKNNDYDTYRAVGRNLISDMINKASDVGTGISTPATALKPKQAKWSAAKAISQFSDMRQKQQLSPWFSRTEEQDIVRNMQALERITKTGGLSGSQTTPLSFIATAAKEGAAGIFTLNPKLVIDSALSVIYPTKIAQAITDPVSRRALSTVIHAKPYGNGSFPARVSAAVGILAEHGILEADPDPTGLNRLTDSQVRQINQTY